MHPPAGRALWQLLHSYAAALPPGEIDDAQRAHAQAWLSAFNEAVETAGGHTCPCGRHWRRIMAAHPPQLRTGADFHAWTVLVHNQVNRLIGRPVYAPLA